MDNGREKDSARATVETGAMGAETTIVVAMGPSATREGMPSASDLHHLLLHGAALSAEPIPPSHRPGANTRRINAVTMETRTSCTSQGIIREETVQAPERDYW